MKICFLCHNICGHGGTERIVSLVSGELAKRGYECYALSMGGEGDSFFDFSSVLKTEYLYEPGNKIMVMHNRVKRIKRFLRENKIDVLITVGGHLNYYGWRAKSKCTWIAWEHEMYDFNKSLYVRVSKYIGIKKANEIVVLTKYDKKRYSEEWKKQADKVKVIGNFTDSFYKKDENVHNTVIAVGRLWNIKQFDLLIEAWALINKEIPGWKLLILGEGSERDKLESLVKNYGLNNVSMPGNKSNISEYYENADIYAMTSVAEGFSLVLLEAMAHSLPIVAFKSNGGVAELVDEKNGIKVEQGNVKELASSLRLLIKQPDKRISLGKASYERSKEYSPDKIIDKWVTLLEKHSS